jgi:hypothetical protein
LNGHTDIVQIGCDNDILSDKHKRAKYDAEYNCIRSRNSNPNLRASQANQLNLETHSIKPTRTQGRLGHQTIHLHTLEQILIHITSKTTSTVHPASESQGSPITTPTKIPEHRNKDSNKHSKNSKLALQNKTSSKTMSPS